MDTITHWQLFLRPQLLHRIMTVVCLHVDYLCQLLEIFTVTLAFGEFGLNEHSVTTSKILCIFLLDLAGDPVKIAFTC